MTTKPFFLKKASFNFRFFLVLFLLAHILLDLLVVFSAPNFLIFLVATFLILGYVLGGMVFIFSLMRLIPKALNEFIKTGLDKQTRQALVLCIVMFAFGIIAMKILG